MLQNLKEVLELGGSSLDKVVKYNGESLPFFPTLVSPKACRESLLTALSVLLQDMKDFGAMNEAYIAVSPSESDPLSVRI